MSTPLKKEVSPAELEAQCDLLQQALAHSQAGEQKLQSELNRSLSISNKLLELYLISQNIVIEPASSNG